MYRIMVGVKATAPFRGTEKYSIAMCYSQRDRRRSSLPSWSSGCLGILQIPSLLSLVAYFSIWLHVLLVWEEHSFALKQSKVWIFFQREYNYAGNGQNQTTIDFFAFGKSKSKIILLWAESRWWHWWLNLTVHNLIKMKMELPFLATFWKLLHSSEVFNVMRLLDSKLFLTLAQKMMDSFPLLFTRRTEVAQDIIMQSVEHPLMRFSTAP